MLYRHQKEKLVEIFTAILVSLKNGDIVYICNGINHLGRTGLITEQEYHFAKNYLYSQIPTVYRHKRFYNYKSYNRDCIYITKRFHSESDCNHHTSAWWFGDSGNERIKFVTKLIRNLKR